MDDTKKLLLEALSCAVRGRPMQTSKLPVQICWDLYRLAMEHHVLPLVANALYEGRETEHTKLGIEEQTKQLVIVQAQRTADFILLLQSLEQHGLRPVVVKGIVCRSLYPNPELRPSTDEDLLIRPDEYDAYCTALAAEGFRTNMSDEAAREAYEIAFTKPGCHLCLELHTSLFPAESDAYGSCAQYFEGVLDRTIDLTLSGVSIRTLSQTDHLLFLICHAYKHFLYGGVGIRQLCDMGLMGERDAALIDWDYVRSACDELHISVFTAALFRICERRLGFLMPESFSEIDVDESNLLEDILSGGLYGVVDIDRAHSSTMTLEAVSADRIGHRRKGVLHSVFLPLESMRGQYSYLRSCPWLLPVAWSQRIFRYFTRKERADPVSPGRSVRIGRKRIDLLKEYQIIR